MLTGRPDEAEAMPESSRPPKIFEFRAKGNWYMALVVIVCRTSIFVSLWSQARQAWSWKEMLSPAPIEASAMPWDHMYCVCQRNPFVKRRSREVCQALK